MHRQSTMQGDEKSRSEIPPGTLEMLILKTLKRFGPMHGYAIAKSIQQTSEDVLRVEEGSLYPALQRILIKGWVTAEWVQAGPKRRSRIYHLTQEGRKQLIAEVSEYRRVSQAIGRGIEPAGKERPCSGGTRRAAGLRPSGIATYWIATSKRKCSRTWRCRRGRTGRAAWTPRRRATQPGASSATRRR